MEQKTFEKPCTTRRELIGMNSRQLYDYATRLHEYGIGVENGVKWNKIRLHCDLVVLSMMLKENINDQGGSVVSRCTRYNVLP